MRRFALIGTLLALLGVGSGAVAQAPSLAAKVAACETGTAAADRFAVFTGSMPRQPRTATMAMRFVLQEALPKSGYKRVALPNWGEWETTSKKNVPGFIFTKRVEQLDAPAAFRAVVSFRWYDAKGKLLRSATRTSPGCVQPDPRPDLHVKRVIFPDENGPTKVVVRNRGRSDSPAFTINASRSDFLVGKTVSGLPSGQQVTVPFALGRCTPGEQVTITLDPADQVDEAVEADNGVSVTCPA